MANRYAASRDEVIDCCRTPNQDRAFRAAVLDAIRRAVPFEGYVWVRTDPVSSVGVAPLAFIPGLDMRRLPQIIRAKYATSVNRWTAMPPGTCAGLAAATAGELSRSALWCAAAAELQVVDMLSAVLRDRFGCWGFIDLWRHEGPVFSAADCTFVSSLLDQVTTAQRSRVAEMFYPAALTEDDRGPALMVFADDLTPVTETPAAEHTMRRLLPTDPGDTPIPAAALNVAAQLLATEQGIDSSPPRAGTHSHSGVWVALRAARLRPSGSTMAASIVVTVDSMGLADRVDVFGRAYGFTKREAEVVVELSRGKSTRLIARELSVSEYTVQDHLKAVFGKTGTSSRAEVVARASGTAAGQADVPGQM